MRKSVAINDLASALCTTYLYLSRVIYLSHRKNKQFLIITYLRVSVIRFEYLCSHDGIPHIAVYETGVENKFLKCTVEVIVLFD